MNAILWMIAGYIVHDAVQPTPIGEVLDKFALPADLLSKKDPASDA